MEKRHKDILIKQRANLVENLNMRDGLYTQLIARKVLNQRMVRSIQNGRTLDQQAEELLNVLEQRGRDAFTHFCDALRDDFQEEIVELYLQAEPSESDTKEDSKSCIQESASIVASDDNQSTLSESSREADNAKVSKSIPENVNALETAIDDRELAKPVTVSGISVCVQQQMFRQIEPSPSGVSQDNVDSFMNRSGIQTGSPRKITDQIALRQSEKELQWRQLEQDARAFYETSILNPEKSSSTVFSVVNGQRVDHSGSPFKHFEKDSSESFSKSLKGDFVNPLLERDTVNPLFGRDAVNSMQGKELLNPLLGKGSVNLFERNSVNPLLSRDSINPLLERDSPLKVGASIPMYEHSLSKDSIAAQQIPSFHVSSSHSPLLSSFQDSRERLQYSPFKHSSNSKPFVFKNVARDLNGAKTCEMLPNTKELPGSMAVNDYEINLKQAMNMQVNAGALSAGGSIEVRNKSEGRVERDVPLGVKHFNQENEIYRQFSHSIPSVQNSESKYSSSERDFMEIQMYRERQNGSSGEKEMLTLPRHVERMCPERVVEGQGLHEKGDYSVQRLARNDSVDTMNKRPFTEIQEINTPTKRFCPVPELTKPEKLTTLQVFDKVDNQVISIPVIDEPHRQPAPPVVVINTHDHINKSQKMPLIGVMDDPEIDLTDGPVNVRVDVSSKQFYLANYKQAYPMRRIPRGKALILNVNEVVGKAERRGTDIDRDNLQHLLCQLHFDVTVFNDTDGLTAKEMVLKLQDFSQHTGHEDAECAVICILSHGEEGYIFGADGKKFELDAVFSLFDNTCCKHLMGKPKIFIIQACRGGALDKGVTYSLDEHDGSDAKIRQVPSMSDMLICYPTQMGYYAWRNRDRGSWYVEALVQVFMKYSKCEDLCTMLNRIIPRKSKKGCKDQESIQSSTTPDPGYQWESDKLTEDTTNESQEVNLLVSKKVSHCPQIEMDQMSQMSEYKSTLRMPHLYFFPGIAGDLYR